MCVGCYEDYGAPRGVTPELVLMGERLRQADEFGGLHIVVSDWNLEDDHVRFCRDDPQSTPDERALASDLLTMTLERRVVAMALAHEYLRPDGSLDPWVEAALGAHDPEVSK